MFTQKLIHSLKSLGFLNPFSSNAIGLLMTFDKQSVYKDHLQFGVLFVYSRRTYRNQKCLYIYIIKYSEFCVLKWQES